MFMFCVFFVLCITNMKSVVTIPWHIRLAVKEPTRISGPALMFSVVVYPPSWSLAFALTCFASRVWYYCNRPHVTVTAVPALSLQSSVWLSDWRRTRTWSDVDRLTTLKSETGCQPNCSVHVKSLRVECEAIDSSFDNRRTFCCRCIQDSDFLPGLFINSPVRLPLPLGSIESTQ